MAIDINRGDWVHAKHKASGAEIIGQTTIATHLGGPAIIPILIPDNQAIAINLNTWDAKVIYQNLLRTGGTTNEVYS